MSPLREDSQPVVIQDEEVRSSRVTNSPRRQQPTASVNRRTALQRFAATAVVGGLGTALTSKIALARGTSPSRGQVVAGDFWSPATYSRLKLSKSRSGKRQL
jgi:hypothetical protein